MNNNHSAKAAILTTKKPLSFTIVGQKSLNLSATAWFSVATIGQWIFGIYILAFYGGAVIQGNPELWNAILPHGYEAGNSMGNFALAVHLFPGAIITIGGPLQFIPFVRKRFPVFHRWLGRIYVSIAFIMSLSGLYLGLSGRTLVGDQSQHIPLQISAVLIMIFAVMTIKNAMARNFASHYRWATRLFLTMSGVWFFRVGLMFWLMINQAPVGFDPKAFQGPFLTVLAIASYPVLPLLVYELYLLAQKRKSTVLKSSAAGTVFIFTIVMAIGIFAATMGMWLPRI